jgi:hypothetical protein
LTQIRSHPLASRGSEFVHITTDEYYLSGVSDMYSLDSIWSRFSVKEGSPRLSGRSLLSKMEKFGEGPGYLKIQPVTSSLLPLQYCADIAMIRAYCEACKSLNSVALFDNDIAVIAVEYAWRQYARKYHIFHMVIHIFFLLVFSISLFVFNDFIDSGNEDYDQRTKVSVAYILQCFVLLLSINQILRIFSRFNSSWRKILDFVSNFWNICGILTSSTTGTGSLLRLINGGDTLSSRCLLSIGSVFIWLQFLYYFTVFRSTGPLIAMILRIASSILNLIFITILVIVGFSQAFWLLADPQGGSLFANFDTGLLRTFEFMMGQFDQAEFDTSYSPSFSILLAILLIFIASILLLNLLIALMSSTFAKVESHQSAERYLLLAQRVIDIAKDLPATQLNAPLNNPETIFALRLSTDYLKMEASQSKASEIEGKFEALSLKLDALISLQSKRM